MSTKRSMFLSIKERVRAVPWWLVSVLFHVLLFVLVARIDIGTSAIVPSKSEFELTIDFHEETEERPLEELEELEDMEELEEQDLSELLREEQVLAPDVNVEDIAPLGELMGDDLLGEDVASLGEESYDEISIISTPGARRQDITVSRGGYQQLTSSMASDARRFRGRLFVWLFDESWSMKDDQKDIMKRIHELYRGLGEELDDEESEEGEEQKKPKQRVMSTVVSYGKTVGQKTNVVLKPTRKIGVVKRAIEAIPIDKSGQENTLAAIRFCLDKFRRFKKIIIVVTDENPSDAGDTEMARTLQHLRKSGTPLFILGREAMFSHNAAREIVILPKGEENKWAANWAWVARGPETPYPEWLGWNQDVWRPHLIGSGFPIYELAKLAKDSGGKYYILASGSSDYDEEKLKDYAPELCSRKEYRQRTKRSPLRKKVNEIRQQCISGMPRMTFSFMPATARDEARQAAQSAKRMIAFCYRSLKELERFKDARKYDTYANKRWEANYDLLIGHLWGTIYQLKEYVLTVQKFGKDGPFYDTREVGHYFLYFTGRKVPSEAALKKDKENATKALQRVIEKHAGTPWATMAQLKLNRLAPMAVRKAGKPGPSGKRKPIPQL